MRMSVKGVLLAAGANREEILEDYPYSAAPGHHYIDKHRYNAYHRNMSMQRCCPEAAVFDGDLAEEASLFKALADPARIAILATLARTEHDVCVCDFTSGLDLNQSTISHHLKLLKDAGLVNSVRRGTWGYYSLEPDARARLEAALESVLPIKVFA
jgi:ArsR family transcriptional regulator